MARTMLGEFKTPECFWSEAVNTACHAINRVYLHRLLKKTSYELLTGNKPNVSYFRVFGSKCYILVKKGRNSKFAPKAVEGFLLGYDSNTKAYRVFNKSSGLVEVSSDVVFDETNGSPREQVVDFDDVDEEEVPTAAIRNMAIGDVRPQEQDERDQPSSSTTLLPPTQYYEQVHQPKECDQGGAQDDHVIEEEAQPAPPTQVRATIQRNHPIDQILGDISKGVTTRSRLVNFCEHYSFVSSIEPFRVEEALLDPDWVLAMQEELNNFKRNEVWTLVPRPKQNVVGTKWVFRNIQDAHGGVTRPRLSPSDPFLLLLSPVGAGPGGDSGAAPDPRIVAQSCGQGQRCPRSKMAVRSAPPRYPRDVAAAAPGRGAPGPGQRFGLRFRIMVP